MEAFDSLFRRESGRLVAALTRVFGVHNLSLAEDVVQDAFSQALEVWKFRGLPENPSAWLLATARNRALDALRRERTARTFAPEIARMLDSEWTLAPALDRELAPEAIEDDLLRMMFSCCAPRLREEVQVALVLHILCGFSVAEIAAAFVSSPAAIEKRITRGKKTLAGSKRLFDVGRADEFAARLPAVQRALYLLFNEGYHGASREAAVRAELCGEAMRLAALLDRHALGGVPSTRALLALMCLHAARLASRTDDAGELLAWDAQDRSRWDAALIAEGERWLERSATGPELSEYHAEAAIAWVHATAARAEDTDWRKIVAMYDRLMEIRPTPVIALNRAIAIAQRDGPAAGLDAIAAIEGRETLARYPFLPAAIGELERRRGSARRAREGFEAALALARNDSERRFFRARIEECGG